jgi:hypothetical protein
MPRVHSRCESQCIPLQRLLFPPDYRLDVSRGVGVSEDRQVMNIAQAVGQLFELRCLGAGVGTHPCEEFAHVKQRFSSLPQFMEMCIAGCPSSRFKGGACTRVLTSQCAKQPIAAGR